MCTRLATEHQFPIVPASLGVRHAGGIRTWVNKSSRECGHAQASAHERPPNLKLYYHQQTGIQLRQVGMLRKSKFFVQSCLQTLERCRERS